ncbi:hypothetical protein MKW92_004008, partial [Papaver armeniacum]
KNKVGGTDCPGNSEESYGPWMLVDKKKNKAKGTGVCMVNQKMQDKSNEMSNRFATLVGQNGSDQNDQNDSNGVTYEGEFNARSSNNPVQHNDVNGGNVKRLERQLQT